METMSGSAKKQSQQGAQDGGDTPAVCRECGRSVSQEHSLRIDDGVVCTDCLYGDARPFRIYPVGTVVAHNVRHFPQHHQGQDEPSDLSEIRILSGMQRFMYRLEEESYLTVIWYLDQQGVIKTRFARGWDGKIVGPFASRTPNRPTPIAVTDVQLVQIVDSTLYVRGLDAASGTPVLDIKAAKKTLPAQDKND